MKSFCKRSVALSASLLCAAGSAWADSPYGLPSLLPLPEVGPQLHAYSAPGAQAATYRVPQSASANFSRVKYQQDSAPPVPGVPGELSPSDVGQQNGGQPHVAPSADSPYDQAAACGWGDDCACNLPTCCNNWFASVGGLVMTRDRANSFWTSFETGNNPNQVLNTQHADADWAGGWETSIGYWFNSCDSCCGPRYGLGVTYWGLDQMNGYASVRGDSLGAGTVSTPIDVTNGNPLIGGVAAAVFFDNATEHRIWRDDEFQNVEINFLSQSLVNTSSTQVTWLAGVRYLHFSERLTFGSVAGGSEFGDNAGLNANGAREAYLSSKVKNDLVGFQLGARAEYAFGPKFGVYVAPKIGIFGNDVSARNTLQSGSGAQGFDVGGRSNTFSMLGELDAGLNYRFGSNWRAYAGYRAMGVTNVALSDNQFLPFLADTPGFADVKDNGSVILHGAFAGLEFNF